MSTSSASVEGPAGMRGMRPSLRWALLLVLLASAGSLWLPSPSVVVPPTTTTESTASAVRRFPLAGSSSESPSSVALTEAVSESQPILPAKGDPFVAPAPPAPPAAPTPKPVPVAQAEQAPAPVLPMPYRYWGRMTGPDGKTQTFVTRGDEPQAVNKGDRLPEGWLVEDLREDAVLLHYPPSGQRAQLAITQSTEDGLRR